VKTGWTVIDVGANIGYYSLLLGQWVGPKGSVHAFEPQPVIFEQLCRHIILNKIDWIKPHQRALGDTIEQRFMTDIPEWNKGMQRIATDKDKGVNQVEITTLDEFVKYEELDRIDFIKVDIEGYEFKFLKGAKQSLNKFRPLILIELNPEA
jgi:FkbM family methyltransferase